MNKTAVAQELVRVARDLTADFGDINHAFNFNDFFWQDQMPKKLTTYQVETAWDILDAALTRVQDELNKVVAKELRKPEYRDRIESIR